MSLAAWVRAEHASFVAASIQEAKSLRVSMRDSLIGSMPSRGFFPVSSMKGDEFVEACTQSLQANLAMTSQLYQLSCLWFKKSQRNCSTSWLTLSVCPSVWG